MIAADQLVILDSVLVIARAEFTIAAHRAAEAPDDPGLKSRCDAELEALILFEDMRREYVRRAAAERR